MKKIAWMLVLLLSLSLLAGCGRSGNTASNGDIHTVPVSAGDVEDPALRRALLSGGAVWYSEQTTGIDEQIVVRELTLTDSGSFSYREGEGSSEYSRFYNGTWTLSGDVLRFDATETDAEGAEQNHTLTAEYRCAVEAGNLTLTLVSDTGFGDESAGMAIHYYQP